MKPKVVEHYMTYFFDKGVFEDKCDVLDYIGEIADEGERTAKTLSISEGFYFIVSKFNGKELCLSPMEVAKRMQMFSYQMVRQARGHAIQSEVAKEAKGWATIVKSFNDTLNKDSGAHQNDFLAEFQVLLVKGAPTKQIDELPPEDVVRG
jgi:hypothetical protein